jgi:hypothetical protein
MAKDNKEVSLAESVAEKIKSRSSRPVITDGKAARFDTRRYNNADYTADGQLSKRFVHNNDEAIAEKIAEGYDMVLMLRPKEIALRAKKFHLDHADALDSTKAPHEQAKGLSPEVAQGAKFYGEMEGKQTMTVAPDTKSRVMGPD